MRLEGGAAVDALADRVSAASAALGVTLVEVRRPGAPVLRTDLTQLWCTQDPDGGVCEAQLELAAFEPGASSPGWTHTLEIVRRADAGASAQDLVSDLFEALDPALASALDASALAALARIHAANALAARPEPPPAPRWDGLLLVNRDRRPLDPRGYNRLPRAHYDGAKEILVVEAADPQIELSYGQVVELLDSDYLRRRIRLHPPQFGPMIAGGVAMVSSGVAMVGIPVVLVLLEALIRFATLFQAGLPMTPDFGALGFVAIGGGALLGAGLPTLIAGGRGAAVYNGEDLNEQGVLPAIAQEIRRFNKRR